MLEPLKGGKSITIHERNIEERLTKIFKVKSRVASEIMTVILKFKVHSYLLRKNNYIKRRSIKSCKCAGETVSNLSTKIRDILPENIEKVDSLKDFKNKIKLWLLINCLCKLCKIYVANVGYV